MDDTQEKLAAMMKIDSINAEDRQKIKDLLSKYLSTMDNNGSPLDDSDIINKLSSGKEPTLTALRLIKSLRDDHAMTADDAFFLVEAWCYLSGLYDTAAALIEIGPDRGSQLGSRSFSDTGEKITVDRGVYMAGYDFPAGYIKIKAISVPGTDQADALMYYAVLNDGIHGDLVIESGNILTQAVVRLTKGQRLETGGKADIFIIR